MAAARLAFALDQPLQQLAERAADRINRRDIAAEPVRHARAAVVGADVEALEAGVAHHGQRIGGHRALAVGGVVGARRQALRVAAAAQVHRDHGVALGQRGRHAVPHRMRLRVAVEQEQGRSAAAVAHPQGRRSDGGDGRPVRRADPE